MKRTFTQWWLFAPLLMLIGFSPSVLAQGPTFQIGKASDAVNPYLSFPVEVPEPCDPLNPPPGGCPTVPPPKTPEINGSMTAVISNITVIPGGGVIGGDLLEFDVTITNTSSDPDVVLTAFAFQSKFSESPALASRIGDKLFYAYVIDGPNSTPGQMGTVKKNGTSNGLFSGKWKGICINSSIDFLPEFNSGLEDESLECAGNRADTNGDGEPEILTGANMRGLRPGESQTIRLRLDSGTTDGALHVVEEGVLTGTVQGIPQVGPNGITYFDVAIDNPGSVLEVVEWGDNKVLRDADGTFDPTFAPAADGLSFSGQKYLTLPRRNFAFTDVLGRNHSCGTYGLDLLTGIPCSGNAAAQPFINFLSTGDLVPGIENFAAILHGFGEFYDPDNNFVPDVNPMGETPTDTRPNQPYNVLCDNCGGKLFTPVAEFYKDNGDGSVTRQMTAGSYGALGSADQYTAFITTDPNDPDNHLEEVVPEVDPGGPQPGPQLGTSAEGRFYDLNVIPGGGINGGDAIEFNIEITNTSTNPDAYLTAFNYQTKSRGLADIGVLDGFTQDRKDIRVWDGLTPCVDLDQGACWNQDLQIGHFPNVIGNGLLFGQMVWQSSNDAGREGPVIADQVYVDPANGFDPVPYWLESVKKNGPFSPILKGNVNFICVKSGLFDNDPDADAACAGEPALLIDPNEPPTPANIDMSDPLNPSGRLGLPPGQTQTVRIRMEFGDFRGALLRIAPGTLKGSSNPDGPNFDPDYAAFEGLARNFDCSDQRELEYAHPYLVGQNIGYLPNTTATWQTPATLEEIEFVIINQPGDAPTVMNFADNFGYILAMAGFRPSAEFYAPDPNPALIGTPYEGTLIRQQVLGEYEMTTVLKPPVASFTRNCTDLSCTFDASGSTDPDGTIVSYSWDFGDGNNGAGPNPGHAYAAGGLYTVTLTVEDNDGLTHSVSQTFGVFDPNVNLDPIASFTASDKGLTVDFDATGSIDVDGTIDSYEWDFGDGNTSSGVTTSHTYAAAGTYTVTLTVEDNDGATHSASQNVTVSLDGNIVSNNSNTNDNGSQTVTWTSSFTDNNYVVGDYIVVRAEWEVDCGSTVFNPNGDPVGVVPRGSAFSPGGVGGTAPVVLASGTDGPDKGWVLFCFQITQMGIKGNAQFNVLVGTDENCDGTVDSSAMLGINVHVRTDGGDI